MTDQHTNSRWRLIRAMGILPFKLLLSSLRDLVLIPLTLGAGFVDLIRLGKTPPRYFRALLRVGERSDHWIDVWYSSHDDDAPPRENVDALLTRIEESVRDPKNGARRARILKRWAERQMGARSADLKARLKQVGGKRDASGPSG